MDKQIAVEILKIAAQLTSTTLNSKIETASTNTVRNRGMEAVFSDCVAETKKHFDDLTLATK